MPEAEGPRKGLNQLPLCSTWGEWWPEKLTCLRQLSSLSVAQSSNTATQSQCKDRKNLNVLQRKKGTLQMGQKWRELACLLHTPDASSEARGNSQTGIPGGKQMTHGSSFHGRDALTPSFCQLQVFFKKSFWLWSILHIQKRGAGWTAHLLLSLLPLHTLPEAVGTDSTQSPGPWLPVGSRDGLRSPARGCLNRSLESPVSFL